MPSDSIPLAPALIAALFGMGCVLSPLGQRDRDQFVITAIGMGLICAAVLSVSLPLWMHRAA